MTKRKRFKHCSPELHRVALKRVSAAGVMNKLVCEERE
jgi:hypothetical protein